MTSNEPSGESCITPPAARGWDYDVENVTGPDARKLVTLEKDGMIWVGIRAFHYMDKKWLNGGAETDERVVAWKDLDPPADPSYRAVPKEAMEDFQRKMREEVIPKIIEDQRANAERVVEARKIIVGATGNASERTGRTSE